MTKLVSAIFLNKEGKLRNMLWFAIFFLILAAFLFPLIFLADYYGFEIALWHQTIMIITATMICQALRHKPQHEVTGKINSHWFYDLLIGLTIGAALMIVPALLLTVSGFVHWQVNAFSASTITSGVLLMAGVALTEELLFRGFIFQRLLGAFGKWPAQVIISGLFLLTHMNNPGMEGTIKIFASVNIFIASILFGIAYIKTKNLAMPLGLHAMANLMQGTVLGFGVSGEKESSLLTPIVADAPTWITGGSFGLEASIVGLFVLILITAALYFWDTEKKGMW